MKTIEIREIPRPLVEALQKALHDRPRSAWCAVFAASGSGSKKGAPPKALR